MVAARAFGSPAPSRNCSASLAIFWLSMRCAPATLMVSGETDMLRYNATEAQAARPNISA